MKKNFIYRAILVCLLVLVGMPLWAQGFKDVEEHYGTISLSGGYSAILSNYDNTKVPGLGGATLGVGWEFRKKQFWMSLGAEGQFISSRMKIGIDTLSVPMHDTEGDEMMYHYATTKWRDDQMGAFVNIPVMFGYMAPSGFYFGVGAKAGIGLWGQEKAKITYQTSSTYDRFIDDFESMPDHFLDEYSTKSMAENLNFKLNAAACFEIGYEVLKMESPRQVDRSTRIKLALYAEYGFLNIYSNSNDRNLSDKYASLSDPVAVTMMDETRAYNDADPSQMAVDNYYLAMPNKQEVDGKTISIRHNPFYIGAKATVLFQIPTPKACHCLQTQRGASWRHTATKATRMTNNRARRIQHGAARRTASRSGNYYYNRSRKIKSMVKYRR